MQTMTVPASRSAKAAIPDAFSCAACGWRGSNESVHETKDVDDDGNVLRRWAAICPSCHSPARRFTAQAVRS